jgi:hypothetical protein
MIAIDDAAGSLKICSIFLGVWDDEAADRQLAGSFAT